MAPPYSRVLVVDLDLDPGQRTLTDWAETADEQGKNLPFDFADENDPAVLAKLRTAYKWDTIFVDTPGNLEPSASERIGLVLDQSDFALLPMATHRASVRPLLRSIRALVEPRGVAWGARPAEGRRGSDSPGVAMTEGEGTVTDQATSTAAVTLDVPDEVGLYVLTVPLRDFQMGRERAVEREGEQANGGAEPDVEWADEQLAHARVARALFEQVEAQMVAVHEAGEQER